MWYMCAIRYWADKDWLIRCDVPIAILQQKNILKHLFQKQMVREIGNWSKISGNRKQDRREFLKDQQMYSKSNS